MGNKTLMARGWLYMMALALLSSCGEAPERTRDIAPKAPAQVKKIELAATPAFNADSAYAFVQAQVDFGPRVPNTEAHKACARYLESTLKRFGLETIVQKATVKAYNGTDLHISNIMGQFRPEAKERILLCAHWDTRPYADRDTKDRTKPIDGANDGASGVGVLLELARAIAQDSLQPGIGYDIVFFDAEDYGKPEESMVGKSSDSWCLGAQYWSANKPVANYNPRYGILLDMVGAKNAVFPREAASEYYAPHVVENTWSIAQAMGHKDYFVNLKGNPITDDHIYLNTIAGIPSIDIVHYEVARSDFGHFHHTHADNMDVIDKNTLGVVGEVVMQVLYLEK